jgi:hypothetical protein
VPEQADSWDALEIAVKGIKEKVLKLPAPPTPRDSWSEKVNMLNRTIEGMTEQARSEAQNEEERLAAARERDND